MKTYTTQFAVVKENGVVKEIGTTTSVPKTKNTTIHEKKDVKHLHIKMAYTYVGETGINIPLSLLNGKSEEEQLKIAYEYAQEHIDEIPVAYNSEYIPYSDNFEMKDIDW